jgi:HSP20 family protein
MSNAIQKRDVTPDYNFGNIVDNIFHNSMRRFFDSNLWDSETPSTGTVPVNVRENEKQYEVDVIAPGCKKEDFQVQIQKNQLIISFTHDEKKNEENEKAGWVRNEYLQRSFSRSFTLDDTIDFGHISAEYRDGILQVILPKNEKAKSISKVVQVK